ncbi:MAG TPA: BlaI/MecI/CopY family transcriptional regulator [Longimicrobium sp.]|nr:BlaI/MecI/CopY family transcriptional regulator [Longimicrobium sp.]
MTRKSLHELARRERQIMEIILKRGRATAAEVHGDLPDPPTYTAVRGMLRLLEEKGYLRHEEDGPRYVYFPTADRRRVGDSALKHLVSTFFDGSATTAVAAMIGIYEKDLGEEEFQKLQSMLDRLRDKRGAS